jgi:hypothetical protein
VKKTVISFAIALTAFLACGATYVVGYVNGADDAFLFSASSEMMSELVYLHQIEKSEIETLPSIIKSNLEVSVAKAKDTRTTRTFPSGYVSRFSFMGDSGVGSQFWVDKSAEFIEKAEAIIEKAP